MARWVFPTPGGPRISNACFSRSQAQVASASSLERCTAGWNAKSKFASVWPVGKPDSRSDVRIRRSSRRSSSPRSNCSSNVGVAQVLLDGAGQDRRQGLGRELQPQLDELVHQHPQVGRCRLGGQRLWPLRIVGTPSSLGRHRATSASAAYRSTGRRSTGSAAISWNLRAIRPSGLGGITSAVPGPS